MEQQQQPTLEGLTLRANSFDEIFFTIKADVLIEAIKKYKNERGFVDGVIKRKSKPSEKGVTHLALLPADKNNKIIDPQRFTTFTRITPINGSTNGQ